MYVCMYVCNPNPNPNPTLTVTLTLDFSDFLHEVSGL